MYPLTMFDKIVDISYLLISGFKSLFFDGISKDQLYDMHVRTSTEVKQNSEAVICFQERLTNISDRLNKIEDKVEKLDETVIAFATAINDHADCLDTIEETLSKKRKK